MHKAKNIMGNKIAVAGNTLRLNTTIVANPILIKFITADPCALSSTCDMAMLDAFAKTKHRPKYTMTIGKNNEIRMGNPTSIAPSISITPKLVMATPD